MQLKLIQTEDEPDFKQFKLTNENNEQIVNFDVEINKETALISYETKKKFQHRGFASYGLNLTKEVLFNDDILFLELIDLSGDYSRKVSENAGFFSPTHTMNYYIALNPRAEEIVSSRMKMDNEVDTNKENLRLLNRIKNRKLQEEKAKNEMRSKLDQLLQDRELLEPDDYEKHKDYVEYLESEISHLQKILESPQDIENKIKTQ